MSLTVDQLATLKAHVLADPALAPLTSGAGTDYPAIAAALNADSNPAFIVWRTAVPPTDWRKAIMVGMAQLDNLTAGKRDSLLWVVQDTLDCSIQSNRDGIDNLCGTQNTLKAALFSAMKRTATRAERVLATGTGSDAVPGTLVFQGNISITDVNQMFAA